MIISSEISELATALAEAQGAMESATKGNVNPHFKSRYADLAAVREAIREPLSVNGLSVVQGLRTVTNGIEVETILLHSSGQSIRETLMVPTPRFDAQGLGSAATYGRRYALMSLIGLASEDDDGNAATGTGGKPVLQPVETGTITEEQAAAIKSKIVEAAADLPRFLKTYNVERIEDMPASSFAGAMRKLEAKIAQNQPAEAAE